MHPEASRRCCICTASSRMKLTHNSEAELRSFYHGSDWGKCLYEMCRRGLLEKHYPKNGEIYYDLAPMLPGWFEFPLSNGEDNPTVQKATELFTSAIGMVPTAIFTPASRKFTSMPSAEVAMTTPCRLPGSCLRILYSIFIYSSASQYVVKTFYQNLRANKSAAVKMNRTPSIGQ